MQLPPWAAAAQRLQQICMYSTLQAAQLGACCWLLWRSGVGHFCEWRPLRGRQQPAPLTRLAICLQATAIDEMTVASSLSR